MQLNSGTEDSRLESVDVLRVVAIVAIIAIHTSPFETDVGPVGGRLDLATLINQLARFAVPYFFVVSGYFWAAKFRDVSDIWAPTFSMARKILFLFVAWSVLYILAFNYASEFSAGMHGPLGRILLNVSTAASDPIRLAFEGTRVHLWFLMSLLWCLFVSAVLIRLNWTRALVALALLMYVVSLLTGAYQDTPLGIQSDFNFRNGPFFGLAFFVTGYWLNRRGRKGSWLLPGLALAGAGFILHFGELIALNHWWGSAMNPDHVLGTYMLGLGFGMIGLSGSFRGPAALGRLGRFVLGVYACHFVVIDLLWPLDAAFGGSPLMDIAHLLAVVVLSFAASFALSRWRLTRGLVV
jgi:surface polysaccharide O-acyltransferase-like enzyme